MRNLIPGSRILDKLYTLYTENGREKLKTKLCLFLLFNWLLLLKIECFVQMTEIYLHGKIYVVLNKCDILDIMLRTKQRIFS